MLLGVLSDTHNQLGRTQTAIRSLRAEGAEALIHCGDITGPEIVAVCAELPCYFVFGNNDADNVPELRQAMKTTGAVCLEWGDIVTLAGKQIAVTHGHMRYDVRRLLAQRPNYLLSGHSHVALDIMDGVVRRINPGSLYAADEFTVALLDLAADELRFLPVPSG